MLRDLRAFVLRGSVVDLAVGVVIGAAFGTVVNSLVSDIITPLLGATGETDFSDLSVSVGQADVRYGSFLNAVISFLLVAVALFFLVVRPATALMHRRRTEPETESPTITCTHCLSSIPERATVCAFCTRETLRG